MMKVKGRNGGRKVYFDFKPHLKEIYEMVSGKSTYIGVLLAFDNRSISEFK